MERKRAKVVIEFDLDPVPGWGHNPEDWRRWMIMFLTEAAGHYHPTVTTVTEEEQS